MKIWTDGGCINNGQPNATGAWAFVSEDGHEASGRLENTTNNRAELQAIIEALRYAHKKGVGSVEVFTDSDLCVKCGMGLWKRKANTDLWQLYEGQKAGLKVQLKWIKGHSGIPQNERCDKLCSLQMQEPSEADDQIAHLRSILAGD